MIFEESNISSLQLKNRIIRSATHEGYGDHNGRPQKGLVELYQELAKGGAGAIITGIVGIQQNGKALSNMNMIDTDELIEDYSQITRRIHQLGVPIIMQLVHAGRQTNRKTLNGDVPIAPSSIRDKMYFKSKPRMMTEIDIQAMIESFVNAIERAQKAGFDGVQLHCAHGFLLSQFLSPYMNTRKDRWGGHTEKRTQIISEIFRKARKRVGAFPLLVKLNGFDHRPSGMNNDEAARIAKLLEENGCDAIEVSCGVMEDGFSTIRVHDIPVNQILDSVPDFKNMNRLLKRIMVPLVPRLMPKKEPIVNYNLSAARNIKQAVSIPVIAVGGIRDMDTINQVIEGEQVDYISMARPFVIEPDIVNRFKDGKQKASRCKSCALCYLKTVENHLRCYHTLS